MPIRILVVDDEVESLRMYVRRLRRTIEPREGNQIPSLEVEEADTISLALEKLSSQTFQILVVDLRIPGSSGEEMGGLELIDKSIELDPLRPIIVITGHGSIELARRTLTQGVSDFIEKSDTAVDELVDAVQRALDARDEKIRESGNPFIPMTGVEPTVFGGRTQELEFFDQKLNRALHNRSSEHFLVLGEWGIGKSTLLMEYKKICQSRGHLASIVPLEPLQSNATPIEAAHSIVGGILRGLPYPVDRFKKVVQFFDSIGFSAFGFGAQVKRDTSKTELSAQAFLHDTLLRLWQDIEDKTGVLVILLDDLDNFMTVPEIVMTLKTTLSMESIKETRILLGMASAPTNWLKLTSMERHHPLARYFMARVELGALSKSEQRETIIKSLAKTGVSFTPEVMTQVFEYTAGHPFEMQVLCSHLFTNQLSNRVDMEVWEKALQATLNDLGVAIFDFWFNQASREEAKVLSVVADAEVPMSAREIQESAKAAEIRISSRNVSKYLQRLVEKKLIERAERGLYELPDRMFRAYIRTLPD